MTTNKTLNCKFVELTYEGAPTKTVFDQIVTKFTTTKHILVFKKNKNFKVFFHGHKSSNPTMRTNKFNEMAEEIGQNLEFPAKLISKNLYSNFDEYFDNLLICLNTWEKANFDSVDTIKKKLPNILNMLDTFAGIGGFSLGLKEITQSFGYCELNKVSQAILKENMNRGYIHFGDIYPDIRKLQIPKNTHLVTAGFPCQGFSLAGKRQQFGHAGSGLFFELTKALNTPNKPPLIFLENVPAVLNGIDEILNELCDKLGYSLFWTVCSAKDSVGAPHKRDRWYALGLLSDYHWNVPLIQKPCFYDFNAGQMPCRTTLTTNKKECISRSMVLGNAVVPPVITYVWNLLGTAASEIENCNVDEHYSKWNAQKTSKYPRHGFCLNVNNTKTIYSVPNWSKSLLAVNPSLNLSYNTSPKSNWFKHTLVFSQNYCPTTQTPSKAKTLSTVYSPVTRTHWATVVHKQQGATVYLTTRTVSCLWSQVKFEKTTQDRTAPVNPHFLEYLMGYPLDYTLLPGTNWAQNHKKIRSYST